jgi:hypothetical protein
MMTPPRKLIAAIDWFRVAHPMQCYYCGMDLVERALDENALCARTLDHVIPRIKGGRYTVPCCNGCNIVKSELSLGAFRQLRFGEFRLFFGEEQYCQAQNVKRGLPSR